MGLTGAINMSKLNRFKKSIAFGYLSIATVFPTRDATPLWRDWNLDQF